MELLEAFQSQHRIELHIHHKRKTFKSDSLVELVIAL